jgi:hypothetical protein
MFSKGVKPLRIYRGLIFHRGENTYLKRNCGGRGFFVKNFGQKIPKICSENLFRKFLAGKKIELTEGFLTPKINLL